MTLPSRATAVAHPNIAFIKYWGNADPELRIPSNGSISMTLGGLESRTSVAFGLGSGMDEVFIGGGPASDDATARVVRVLDRVRDLAGRHDAARVDSFNSFPTGAGIASSASAFAALALAASAAAGLNLDPRTLSRLARRGSGSACRSVFGGFVEWIAGGDDESSFALPLAGEDHWDLHDLVALVHRGAKTVGSSEGHRRAGTSPLQGARLEDAPNRISQCRRAVLERDFAALADVMERDSLLMHAVMKTSVPAVDYSSAATRELIRAVPQWRADGLAVAFTQDAGPNVHVICLASDAPTVADRLRAFPGVLEVIGATPGGPAWVERAESG